MRLPQRFIQGCKKFKVFLTFLSLGLSASLLIPPTAKAGIDGIVWEFLLIYRANIGSVQGLQAPHWAFGWRFPSLEPPSQQLVQPGPSIPSQTNLFQACGAGMREAIELMFTLHAFQCLPDSDVSDEGLRRLLDRITWHQRIPVNELTQPGWSQIYQMCFEEGISVLMTSVIGGSPLGDGHYWDGPNTGGGHFDGVRHNLARVRRATARGSRMLEFFWGRSIDSRPSEMSDADCQSQGDSLAQGAAGVEQTLSRIGQVLDQRANNEGLVPAPQSQSQNQNNPGQAMAGQSSRAQGSWLEEASRDWNQRHPAPIVQVSEPNICEALEGSSNNPTEAGRALNSTNRQSGRVYSLPMFPVSISSLLGSLEALAQQNAPNAGQSIPENLRRVYQAYTQIGQGVGALGMTLTGTYELLFVGRTIATRTILPEVAQQLLSRTGLTLQRGQAMVFNVVTGSALQRGIGAVSSCVTRIQNLIR